MILAFAAGLGGILFSTAVFVLFLLWFDRYEKEPVFLLNLAFFWGMIPAVVLALILEMLFSYPLSSFAESQLTHSFFSTGIIAPFVEETVKGFFLLLLFVFFRKHVDNELDGAIYGALCGLGFALTEDVFYFLGSLGQGPVSGYVNVFFRSFIFGSNHAFWSAIIGFAFGKAILSSSAAKGILIVAFSWLLAVFLHGVHNICVVFAPHTYCLSFLVDFFFNFGGLILLLVVLTFVLKKEGKWIEKFLRPEVDAGLISEKDLSVIKSAFKRSSVKLKTMKRGGSKESKKLGLFFQTASELSFKRHRHSIKPTGDLQKTITRLSEKFTSLAPDVRTWLSS